MATGLEQFHIPRFFSGILLILAVGLVTVGGLKRIAHVAVFFVPFMCIVYFLGAVILVLVNIQRLPETLVLIFKSAFTPVAATGGFAGAGFGAAIRWGIARGVFSNEAGLGSAPMAHAFPDRPSRTARAVGHL